MARHRPAAATAALHVRVRVGQLQSGGWLAPEAFVYLETPAAAPPSGLPAAWQPWRDGKAGEVGYHLLRRNARSSSEQESAT